MTWLIMIHALRECSTARRARESLIPVTPRLATLKAGTRRITRAKPCSFLCVAEDGVVEIGDKVRLYDHAYVEVRE